jgi:hypothetical protein
VLHVVYEDVQLAVVLIALPLEDVQLALVLIALLLLLLLLRGVQQMCPTPAQQLRCSRQQQQCQVLCLQDLIQTC